MAENGGEAAHHEESFMEKIAEKLHLKKEEHHEEPQHVVEEEEQHHEAEEQKQHEVVDTTSSSSSDSEDEKVKEHQHVSPAGEDIKAKIWRLFGREKPVHQVLGGGKPADVFLWRNKKISAGVLGTGTAIWILFELLEYHLLTLVCHILIFTLAVLFLWANASTFINKSAPHIPEVHLPEQPFLQFAAALRHELNKGFTILHEIATGKDLKKFLGVVAGLWLLSVVGKCTDFLTLFYINFVLLHTVPVLYEKYEDKVDAFGEKAMAEAKKYYAIVDEKYLSKIPRGPLKNRKSD